MLSTGGFCLARWDKTGNFFLLSAPEADNTIAFHFGQMAFNWQIKQLMHSRLLPGYCCPSYKTVEETGRVCGSLVFWDEMLNEICWLDGSDAQIALPRSSLRFSLALSFFPPLSRCICITHVFLLDANQLYSHCVSALAPTGGSGQGSCTEVRLFYFCSIAAHKR